MIIRHVPDTSIFIAVIFAVVTVAFAQDLAPSVTDVDGGTSVPITPELETEIPPATIPEAMPVPPVTPTSVPDGTATSTAAAVSATTTTTTTADDSLTLNPPAVPLEGVWPTPSPVLVQQAPLALRRYVRFLFDQKDVDRNHLLNEEEWSFIPAGQALDLDGDLQLNEEELLYFLNNFAEGRTIFRPNKPIATDDLATPPVELSSIRPLSKPVVPPTTEADSVSTETPETAEDATETSDNPAAQDTDELAGVEDPDLLKLLIQERNETVLREYVVPSESLKGVPRWFIVRDTNGDGQLSLREFAPSLSVSAVAFFGELDLNGDGYVTADEMRTSLEARKKK